MDVLLSADKVAIVLSRIEAAKLCYALIEEATAENGSHTVAKFFDKLSPHVKHMASYNK